MPNVIRIKRGDAEVLDKYFPLADGELAVTRYKEITGGPQRGEKVLDQTLRVGVYENIKDYSVIGSESIFYETSYLMHLVGLLTQYCKDLEDNIRNSFLIRLKEFEDDIYSAKIEVSTMKSIVDDLRDIIGDLKSDDTSIFKKNITFTIDNSSVIFSDVVGIRDVIYNIYDNYIYKIGPASDLSSLIFGDSSNYADIVLIGSGRQYKNTLTSLIDNAVAYLRYYSKRTEDYITYYFNFKDRCDSDISSIREKTDNIFSDITSIDEEIDVIFSDVTSIKTDIGPIKDIKKIIKYLFYNRDSTSYYSKTWEETVSDFYTMLPDST